jgi:hypothetical protein
MGKASLGRAVNHFSLIRHLSDEYPEPTQRALLRVCPKFVQRAAGIVREFPFNKGFSPLRKTLVTRVLAMRADKLDQIAQEGGK